ncbi:TPA_asm: hypothetical protein [Abeoforma parvovirus]|nr:TPA_asm: hypothetical protein [Abeoforma parvovirus]
MYEQWLAQDYTLTESDIETYKKAVESQTADTTLDTMPKERQKSFVKRNSPLQGKMIRTKVLLNSSLQLKLKITLTMSI